MGRRRAHLEASQIDVGEVQGIVGIKRWHVVVDGFANHAGTTPMDRRQDALVAAARFIDVVQRIARDGSGRHVATVGTIRAEPGAPNVIPGRVTVSLEIRAVEMATIDALFVRMRDAAATIGTESGTHSASYRSIGRSRRVRLRAYRTSSRQPRATWVTARCACRAARVMTRRRSPSSHPWA